MAGLRAFFRSRRSFTIWSSTSRQRSTIYHRCRGSRRRLARAREEGAETRMNVTIEEQTPPAAPAAKGVHSLPSVTIRFAGDSGDGMQLAGTQFTDTSALVGNDIS